MTLDLKPAMRLLRRLYPTLARLAGIFAGIYIMGAHDFLAFYFVHMMLKSLTALFFIDSDADAFLAVRKNSTIELPHFTFLMAMSAVSSILILTSFMASIWLIDNVISPDTIDIEFFKLYALTIVINLLQPLIGVIRAKGGVWIKAFLLRGRHLLNLLFIFIFFVVGIDGALLPYVWLLTSILVSFLVLASGLFYFKNLEKTGVLLPLDWSKGKTISQKIVHYSARRTNNRATFLATKGVISAFLGPFAGLALKSIRFGNQVKRQKYIAKIKKRGVVDRIDGRIPDAVKRGLAEDRPFRIVLTLAIVILAVMIALRGTLDAFLLLGLLVLVSKMLSVSLRVLVLNKLLSRGSA